MAQSAEGQSGSEGDMPQLPPMSKRVKLTGGGNPSKPPKILKKKSESELEEKEDDIPSAHSQPEDEQITDSKTLFSDGNSKGGHGRERNTAAEMSDPEGYKTPPGFETTTERNNRLQRIRRHWAKKWFNHENVRRKYQILFAFTAPGNDCIAEGCLGPDDVKARPTTPKNANTNSLKTIVDFPEEVKKRAKSKSNLEARAAKKNQVEQRNVELTQQDVQEKKDQASALKERNARKPVSPRAS